MRRTSRPARLMTSLPWLPLGDGVVGVFRADLDLAQDDLVELLCERELQRASGIRSGLARRRWMRSRGILRSIVGSALGCDPASIRFELSRAGKPMLAPGQGSALLEGPTLGAGRIARARCTLPSECSPSFQPWASSVHFNLSHSGGLAVYALSRGQELGVDLELIRRRPNEVALAARVLGGRVAAELAGLDGRARTETFLRAWVAQEARLKCVGCGLSAPAPDGAFADVSVSPLNVGSKAIGALAVKGRTSEVRYLRWRL